MRDLIFLSHRIPYPPDKGEKIRSWHIFEHLARSHRLHLGCFIDDPLDWMHLSHLRPLCADIACFGIARRWHQVAALFKVRPGVPLSIGYFHDVRLQRWVAGKLARGINRAFVYCSVMAPYMMQVEGVHRVLDMVDVDSDKWRHFATQVPWPACRLWAREGHTLLAFERRAALEFEHTVFVSAAECRRFEALAPETRGRVGWFDNGVDLDRFSPALGFERPFAEGGPDLVFTGTMDYRPNADAVVWFAHEVLPRLWRAWPDLRFWIVGANPAMDVIRLTKLPGVHVTGRVADVRPYLAHAAVVVAPLRMARGIQNKVLEAMAMGRPVVTSRQAFEGVKATAGSDLLVATSPDETERMVREVLLGQHPGLGRAARRAVERSHCWTVTLAPLDRLLESAA